MFYRMLNLLGRMKTNIACGRFPRAQINRCLQQMVVGTIIVMGLISVLASCGRTPPPAPAQLSPNQYRLDIFRDLAIPVGFIPMQGREHVATALADGSIRLLETTLISYQQSDESPQDIKQRLVNHLQSRGWQNSTSSSSWHNPQLQEVLDITTGRHEQRNTIRLTLKPARSNFLTFTPVR